MAFQYNSIDLQPNSLSLTIIGDGVSSSGTIILPASVISSLWIAGVGFPSVTSYPVNYFGSGITYTAINLDFTTGILTFSLSSVPAAGTLGSALMKYAWTGQ